MERPFELEAPWPPKGDQPGAIEQLVKGFDNGEPMQVLLGVTGSGKTFTVANVIARLNTPTLVISHNKTLAAQLYTEFKEFFPNNRVEYFVSYYDYYQPEAYIPQKDLYIEKDASINDDIDRLRLAATSAILSRHDTIVVASVSCIYGLGDPVEYKDLVLELQKGARCERDDILRGLVHIRYDRNDIALERGHFRVRGDVIEVAPAYEETAVRIELFGDMIESLSRIDPLTGNVMQEYDRIAIYPARHFVMPDDKVRRAVVSIRRELRDHLAKLEDENKLLEAQRLRARTNYDIEMLEEVGYCSGIENYSRHFSGRMPGERPHTLFDYFGDDLLVVIDESHVTLPQVRGMFNGDYSRKKTLVEHGFRLPSALDNRPMKFHEFEKASPRMLCVSATPGPYELEKTGGLVVEQIIRPTGLVDPAVRISPAEGQVESIIVEIRKRVEEKERVLVTTLTKRLAEDLSEYIDAEGIGCKYLHSEIDTLDRVEILNDLRKGVFDVLVGVNLLREGLDLPEVALGAILDADKEGFLRSETSLVQTIGLTARNVNAEVILYGDVVTRSMKKAVDETDRRRELQVKFNEEHGITPQTIRKAIKPGLVEELRAQKIVSEAVRGARRGTELEEEIRALESRMLDAARQLEFEEAARIRDEIRELKARLAGADNGNGNRKKRRGKRSGRTP
ncbi:MAG: excinuclease ABC subunit UvrB [Planctomycetota bacterium]|nr:MAG: excinuclease ABC subunit UvrB [Planctomycetota bacterium]